MTLRFAILGAARIAGPALISPAAETDRVEIVAVGASSAARARAFAAEHAIGWAGSYEDVLARRDVDVVYVALPPSAHAEWTLKALAAGKHVFLEKPATTTLAEARAIVSAAEAAGLRLIEAFHYRWHPFFTRAVEVARSGVLGELVSAEAEFSAPIPRNAREFRWQRALGGGALADLGCYCVSWLRHLAGSEPVVAVARQWLEPDGADRRTEAELAFPDGLRGHLVTDMAPEHGQRVARASLTGTRGTLELVNPLAPHFGHAFRLTIDGQTSEERFALRPTFAFQLEGVAAAIETGAPVPVEGADILGNAAAMQAIRDLAG